MAGRRLLGAWVGACLLAGIAAAAHEQPEGSTESVSADRATSTVPSTTTSTTAATPDTTTTTTTTPPEPSRTVATQPLPPPTTTPRPEDSEPLPMDPPSDPGSPDDAHPVSGDGIWVVAADGSRLQRVAERCNTAAVRWTDDGRALAVGDGMSGVDIHHLDGRHQRIDIPMGFHEWDASPTGRFVVASAFEGEQLTTDVWGYDGSRLVIATGPAALPVVAPDGQSIYLFRHGAYRAVTPSGAVLQDWRPTTFTPAMAHAQFSPDGRRILGHSNVTTTAVLDLDSGTVTELPDLSPGHVNRWFDDQTIVAGLGGPAPRLVLRDWRTGSTTELAASASWPSAQHGTGLVAFTSYRSTPTPIDVVHADGSGRRTLIAPAPGSYALTLRWSPDQQLLAFATCD